MQHPDPEWLNYPPAEGDEAAWLKARNQRHRRIHLRHKAARSGRHDHPQP